MTDRFTTQVMLCWPSDRKEIADLNARIDDPDQRFTPTVEHTLSECDGCGRGIWIGQQQLQLVRSPFVRAKKLCMFCAGIATRVLNLSPQEVNISMGETPARRRTA